MLSLYNESVRTGRVTVHPWQAEVMARFARKQGDGIDYHTQINRINLVANNGSGKSAMVVAPCAVWAAMTFPFARIIITSSSGRQLDQQTGRAVKHLCEQVNRLHGKPLWELKYRDYTFRPNASSPVFSTIEMYATDDPGQAEGYHPHEPGAVFVAIVDEAKTVSDDIGQAVERCNGKSHWMNVSSPGAPQGFFYTYAVSPRWWTKKVTAYDCPHLKLDEIEGARETYGEQSAWFRSAYLAEFTSANEQVVIPYERISRAFHDLAPAINDGIRRAGVDLSGGGDENCVSVWDGNQNIALESFQVTDLRQTTTFLVNIFRKYSLKGENINIDDGYVGRAIVHGLRDHGYHCVAVNFGASAYNSVAYANRGTELWFNFERHLDYLRLYDDRLLRNQLCSRYYKQSDRTNKIILESKREARAAGHKSPDRADATVLAFATVPVGYFCGAASAAVAKPSDPGVELWQRLAAAKGQIDLTDDELLLAEDAYRRLRAGIRRPTRQETSRYGINKYVGADQVRVQLHNILGNDSTNNNNN